MVQLCRRVYFPSAGCSSASLSVILCSGSHCVSPSTNDHAPTLSNKAKSQDSLPGAARHSCNTDLPAASSSTLSAASSRAARARSMAPGGCRAGTASRSNKSPTPNASNASVGTAPVAVNPASPFPPPNNPANPPAMPDFLVRVNCSGAPYTGSKIASSPEHPWPVSKSAAPPRSIKTTPPPGEPALVDVSSTLSGLMSR
mmetsp:Transcript_23884/g.38410  ORF Transcript_23884/g.38410 Transcript_23884/m.38410 type:complete len:200 (-) Transcript_23884:881-1480(-)